jgi:O-antigen ligase
MRYVWFACACAVLFALFFNPLAAIEKYRPNEDTGTLTGRIPLWTLLISSMLERSPWFGIGFISGSREVMQDIDPMLGSGHSQFVDVLVGSGIIGAVAFLILTLINLIVAAKLLRHAKRALLFEILGLFATSFIMGLVGNEIDSTAPGFVFWVMISLLPYSLSIASAQTNPT